MNARNVDDYVRQIIRDETTFMRHYQGKIVNNQDPLNRGCVQVLIYDLGFSDASGAIWCSPRQGNSMSIPLVDTWAEVYFINGDMRKPVYLYPCTEVSAGDSTKNIPQSFDGTDVKTHVLFQSPDTKTDNIKYKVIGGVLTFLEGTESAVLGDKLQTYLTNQMASIAAGSAHTHNVIAVGSPTGPAIGFPSPTAPTDILSTNIKVK